MLFFHASFTSLLFPLGIRILFYVMGQAGMALSPKVYLGKKRKQSCVLPWTILPSVHFSLLPRVRLASRGVCDFARVGYHCVFGSSGKRRGVGQRWSHNVCVLMMPKMGAVGRDKYACSTGSLLMLCTELSLGDASMIMGHDTGSTYDRIARSFRTHCGTLGWISRQALFYLMCLSRGALSPCRFPPPEPILPRTVSLL